MHDPILILPGYGDSGPDHWQTQWQRGDEIFRRVAQDSWERPRLAAWVESLDRAVAEAGPRAVLVAHSLGCLLVAHWASRAAGSVRAALLVAPPDPSGASFPLEASTFDHVPRSRLPFPTVLVASSDDPYASLDFSRELATAWGSRLVTLVGAGHVNGASGLGAWPEGRELLNELLRHELL